VEKTIKKTNTDSQFHQEMDVQGRRARKRWPKKRALSFTQETNSDEKVSKAKGKRGKKKLLLVAHGDVPESEEEKPGEKDWEKRRSSNNTRTGHKTEPRQKKGKTSREVTI